MLLKLCFPWSTLPSFFLFDKTFLKFFMIVNHTIVFFSFLSVGFAKSVASFYALMMFHVMSISVKTCITDSSNVPSQTESGIPMRITYIFQQLYCVKALWSDSYFAQSLSSRSYFYQGFSCSMTILEIFNNNLF